MENEGRLLGLIIETNIFGSDFIPNQILLDDQNIIPKIPDDLPIASTSADLLNKNKFTISRNSNQYRP